MRELENNIRLYVLTVVFLVRELENNIRLYVLTVVFLVRELENNIRLYVSTVVFLVRELENNIRLYVLTVVFRTNSILSMHLFITRVYCDQDWHKHPSEYFKIIPRIVIIMMITIFFLKLISAMLSAVFGNT